MRTQVVGKIDVKSVRTENRAPNNYKIWTSNDDTNSHTSFSKLFLLYKYSNFVHWWLGRFISRFMSLESRGHCWCRPKPGHSIPSQSYHQPTIAPLWTRQTLIYYSTNTWHKLTTFFLHPYQGFDSPGPQLMTFLHTQHTAFCQRMDALIRPTLPCLPTTDSYPGFKIGTVDIKVML